MPRLLRRLILALLAVPLAYLLAIPILGLIPVNGADNVLHLLSTIAGLAIALWPDRDRARR